MKVLLLQPSQPSGSMLPQRSTSQPVVGGILSTLSSDFPELSRLFGTGTIGSKSTSGTPGSRECAKHSSQYLHAWSDLVSSLRKQGTSGWLTPLSSVSIWWITKVEHFCSMDSSPTGRLVRINATILYSCTTGTRLDETLIRCYPSPYRHPIPYSGKGRPLWKSDKGLLKSVSAYILYNKAPVFLFTPYKLFSWSMLTFEYWSLDANWVVSNYHYCPDYTRCMVK